MTSLLRPLVVFGLAAAVGGQPPPAPPETARQMAEKYGRNQQRTNGAKLSITAVPWVRDGRPAVRVRVRWTIDYDGPRPPLIVARPSLDDDMPTGSQLAFFFDDDGGKGQQQSCGPSSGFTLALPRESWFARSVGGRPLTGTLEANGTTGGGQAKAAFDRRTVWVQLRHRPMLRGDVYGAENQELDAWTGELISNVVQVDF